MLISNTSIGWNIAQDTRLPQVMNSTHLSVFAGNLRARISAEQPRANREASECEVISGRSQRESVALPASDEAGRRRRLAAIFLEGDFTLAWPWRTLCLCD